MRYNIYFYAVDPGSVSIMSSITNKCPKNMKFYWVAEGYAKSLFDSNNIEYLSVNMVKQKVKMGDYFFLGSQINTNRTSELIKWFSIKKIITIFIFDHWANYGKHFTLPEGSYFFPNKILVMDKYVKSNLIKIGVSNESISIIGHPGIDFELNNTLAITSRAQKKIKQKEGLMLGNKTILLALEPLSIDFSSYKLVYDEFSILLLVYNCLKDFGLGKINFIVRLHPRQSKLDFQKFIEQKKIDKNVKLSSKEMTLAESLSIADIVIGMTSVYLVKSLALGKPTVSLQLNPQLKYIQIPYLDKIKISDPLKLKKIINKYIYHNDKYNISLPTGGVKKVWNKIIPQLNNNK